MRAKTLMRPCFYKRFDLKIEIYVTLLNLNQLKQLTLFSKGLVKTDKSAGGTFLKLFLQMLFLRTSCFSSFDLKIQISITFLTHNKFQQMNPFQKELNWIFNLSSATFCKLCPEMLF